MMAAAQDGLEQQQRRRLSASRAVATGMLVVSAAIFAATLTVHQPGHAVLLLRAVAEASLVGGLADWFAVTALFRRPLGLPIPHTAILPANKDRIGEGLARFLDRYFLAPELLVAELRSLNLAEWIAAWLAAVAERRRRWIPRAVTREIARAMLRAAGQLIEDLQRPDGDARQALIAKIDEFAADLEASEGLGLGAALNRPEVRSWIAASWERLRTLVLADLDAASSRTRRALAMMILSLGDALQGDAAMRERLDQTLEAVVVEALPWRAELVRFVEEVVRRWQPDEFTSRIETAVGADLQYIRMNGALVGGLVGGGLYLLTWLAG